jgi:hypothetical protein
MFHAPDTGFFAGLRNTGCVYYNEFKGSRKNNFTFLCADALVPGCVAKA